MNVRDAVITGADGDEMLPSVGFVLVPVRVVTDGALMMEVALGVVMALALVEGIPEQAESSHSIWAVVSVALGGVVSVSGWGDPDVASVGGDSGEVVCEEKEGKMAGNLGGIGDGDNNDGDGSGKGGGLTPPGMRPRC